MIPARYGASRFPGKLMQDLGGKTVITRTYEATKNTKLFDEVYVVTDSDVIFNEIEIHGGKAIMSKKEHECGSDRIAEAVEGMDIDIVINVQGDEPFTEKESLKKLIKVFKTDNEKKIDLASLMVHTTDEEEINNEELHETLPILSLRNTVLFPGVVIPITAGRDKSIKLINDANKGGKVIGVVSQKDESVENPTGLLIIMAHCTRPSLRPAMDLLQPFFVLNSGATLSSEIITFG